MSGAGVLTVVYDHSPRQLELGRKLAFEQNLQDVEYIQASYEQVAASRGLHNNDLVLFLRGIDLRLPAPGTGDVSLNVNACPSRRPRPDADLQAAMSALARLLSRRGVGVIACVWSSWGLINLFEAIRRAGMGVDWRLSRCRAAKINGKWGIGDAYTFVRRDMPHLGKNSREDALAFVHSCKFRDEPKELLQDQLASDAAPYRDGDELLFVEGTSSVFQTDRLRLFQKHGMLLLEAFSANGPIRGGLHTLAGIASLLEEVQLYLDEWTGNGQGGIRRQKFHPRLKRFIRFCQQGNQG